MTPAERLGEISFDLYERYVLLERIGRLFPPRETKYRVLDVGGHTPRFWPDFSSMAASLIPDAAVVVLDMVSTSELKNYVQANGVQLPFRDHTFDLVCSLDTLEHIPVERRPDFLAELLRVTQDGLYIAFPFDSPSNRWAESVVMEYTSVLLKHPVQALVEHRQCGLPDRDAVLRIFSQTPHPWVTFNQGNTDVWLLMMLTYHTLRMPGTDFVQELNRRFNQVYAAQDWADPAYRAGYLLSKRLSIADLEAVRIAFHRTERRPDLQSILAFCQLFLNIAQNGRVNVDKDRHIRHIENALADARVYKEKWADVAAVLHNLEVSLLDTPSPAAPGETPAHWPRERMSYLVDAAVNLRAAVQAERESTSQMIRTSIDGLGSQIAEQQDVIRGRIDALHNRLEFQARLDGRLRDLEIGLVTNKRAVQAIYDSRIWKVLSRAGGWLLRLTGQETPPNQTAWTYRGGPIVNAYHGATDDFLALVCDYPGETGVLPMRDVVEIRGWALASSGIDHVAIQAGGDPPVHASYGISRPDVARSYPDRPDAEHSGYRFFWDTTGLSEGPCTVRVTAVARSGQTREVLCRIIIDWKTPPDYGLWIARNEPSANDLQQLRLAAATLTDRPRISIAVPVYKTPLALLTLCIDSVLNQTYPEWELCLADDGSYDSDLAGLLEDYRRRDRRILVAALERNRGISGATNAALRLSTSEYVAFLDHDDELAPFALSEVVSAIHEHPETDLFYSDEDKIDEHGRRYDAFFKPDWSPDLFRSCNYICHFVVLRRSLLDKLGGLDERYNGAQDYEFLLRAS